MNLSNFIENFAEAIEDLDENTINPNTQYRKLEQWDSLAVLSVLSMIDLEYGIRLKAEVLKTTATIEDLFALVHSKNSNNP